MNSAQPNWITLRELLAVRRRVVRDLHAQRGVHNAAGLYSAIRRPFTAFGGHVLYPTLLEKVAVLLHSLVAFHPFKDGNEATALVAAEVCLRLNGHRIRPDADTIGFMRSVARGQREIESIREWLEGHVEVWGEG